MTSDSAPGSDSSTGYGTKPMHVIFDFLGFNVRRYRGKLLIKPSNAAPRRIRERLSAEMLDLRGANAEAVIQRLSPI
jgi:hypothetical protein